VTSRAAARIANAHPHTIIGSYPFQDEDKKPNTNLVVRSRDPDKLNAAMAAVKEMLAALSASRSEASMVLRTIALIVLQYRS